MWDSEEFSCRDCHMAFRSGGLLDKHKARFCLGSDIGDPAALKRGRVEFTKPETSTWRGPGPCRTSTPDLICLREVRAERTRQSKLKTKASEEEEASDPKREGDHQGSTSDSIALRRLTNEFHQLRMSIQESMGSLPPQHMSETISAVPEASQVAHSEKVREMSEHHGHQLAEIRAHTDHLEQQKEEIDRRLAALAGLSSTSYLESLLQDLREQEDRNEDALQHLRTQISLLQAQQQGAKDADAPPDSAEDRRTQHVTFDLISSGDGPLSNQIRSLRLAYMQSGGSDPEILAQMHDLQAESHTLEQTQLKQDRKTGKKRVKPRPQAVESGLSSLELDNQRLEEEIQRIQLARQRQHGEEAGAEFQLMQRQHVQQLAGLQGEIESLRREVERTRAHRQPPPPPPPPLFSGRLGAQLQAPLSLEQCKAQPSLLGRRLLDTWDTLGPAPYDPAAGFVIFYDMLVGVDAPLKAVRLVVGLFSLGQERGNPTPLPPVQCQPAGALPYPYDLPTGNYAILAAKQPVPRIQPSPSLSLLVEVQAAGGLDPSGQEIQDLVSRGWTRLQLFDQQNQVQSGYWKVPFRILPVKPSLSSGQVNSVPQLGNMELCLRVANARDGEVQSLAKVDPSDRSHYKYPALASVAYGGSAPHHLTSLQPFSNPALCPPSSLDQVDPPTVEGSNQR